MRHISTKLAVSLLIGGLVLLTGAPAGAWPVGLDFITGGGWFVIDNPYAQYVPATPGARANFGWHGGVKNGAYWGNGNYVDHGGAFGAAPFRVHSTEVLDYICVSGPCPATSTKDVGTRDICGTARVNAGPGYYYRVRMHDAGEPGRNDKFGIILYNSSGFPVYFSQGQLNGGGNIQLHGHNPSNTAPSPSGVCDALDWEWLFSFQ